LLIKRRKKQTPLETAFNPLGTDTMSTLSSINPIIRRKNNEVANSRQYERFAKQLVATYQMQLGKCKGEESRRAQLAAIALLNQESHEQSLRTFVQRLLLIIHSAKMNARARQLVPPASCWFDPNYPNNILAQQNDILNACF